MLAREKKKNSKHNRIGVSWYNFIRVHFYIRHFEQFSDAFEHWWDSKLYPCSNSIVCLDNSSIELLPVKVHFYNPLRNTKRSGSQQSHTSLKVHFANKNNKTPPNNVKINQNKLKSSRCLCLFVSIYLRFYLSRVDLLN